MKDLRIGVIYGGRSPEHDISIASSTFVVKTLKENGYDVLEILIEKDGKLKLKKNDSYVDVSWSELKDRIDFALPILHGMYGEDGSIQGMFEMLDIPYGGSEVLGSSVAMDKIMTKHIFSACHVPTVPFIGLDEDIYIQEEGKWLEKILEELTFPIFVKPANLGSSMGVSKVKKREELKEAIGNAFQYDRRVLVETGVSGRELEIGVLGDKLCEVSSIGEVIPSEEFYTLNAKYNGDKPSKIIIPAIIDDESRKKIETIAKDAYRAVDGTSFGRVDFFLTDEGEVFVNEINTIPGFTEFSVFPKLWADAGVSSIELIERIIENGYKRYKAKSGRKSTV